MTRKFEETLAQKDTEIERLTEELNSQKSRSVTKQVTHNSQVADLESNLAEMVEELEKTKERVALYKDYDEIKKELEVLKVSVDRSPFLHHWKHSSFFFLFSI